MFPLEESETFIITEKHSWALFLFLITGNTLSTITQSV